MTTQKGVWGLQQVRDKYLQSLWSYSAPGDPSYLYTWGRNDSGQLGQNSTNNGYSSPVQIGNVTTWGTVKGGWEKNIIGSKSDGTLWVWGTNNQGVLGLSQALPTKISSPTQIPGTTWTSSDADKLSAGRYTAGVIKTDGTLWMWGANEHGILGQNEGVGNTSKDVSSPIQIPGTTWKTIASGGSTFATKTDGTAWGWGRGGSGALGQNNRTNRSSPTQIPGTNWSKIVIADAGQGNGPLGLKTDGTLWAWGLNWYGALGLSQSAYTYSSSPTQIPGTTWDDIQSHDRSSIAKKTDGTLWTWGKNDDGMLGLNDTAHRSSPVQVGTDTTWSQIFASGHTQGGIKTDGTLWAFGDGREGQLGQNDSVIRYSSPVQIPGTAWTHVYRGSQDTMIARKRS